MLRVKFDHHCCPSPPSPSLRNPLGWQVFFVGTYTATDSKGIYRCLLSLETGKLKIDSTYNHRQHPIHLCYDEAHRILYSADGWPDTGQVSAFKVLNDGCLKMLSTYAWPESLHTSHIIISPDRKTLICSNTDSGDVVLLYLRPNGTVGGTANLERFVSFHCEAFKHESQWASRPKGLTFDPSGRYLVISDYGSDAIYFYEYVEKNLSMSHIATIALPQAQGPSKVLFRDEQIFFVLGQLSSRVFVYQVHGSIGEVEQKQTVSTLPLNFVGESFATDCCFGQCGDYLYVSNCGHDSIACFYLDAQGVLQLSGFFDAGGNGPISIVFCCNYLLVGITDSNRIVSHKIDLKTGLARQQQQHSLDIPTPMHIILTSMGPKKNTEDDEENANNHEDEEIGSTTVGSRASLVSFATTSVSTQ